MATNTEVVRIVPSEERFIAGFHQAVDVVARERRYIGLVEAPPLTVMQSFVRSLLAGAGVQVVALNADDKVVGWCDVVTNPREGFRHCGSLGMGLLPETRGRGVGTRLVQAAIDRSWELGLERIELEVYASNSPALALYRKVGFVIEGVKVRARKLDGRYDDNIFMALMRGAGH